MENNEAERRQLTVMFCDIVESTAIAARLDPEELRDVVRGCQEVAVAAIERFHGHVAQYLGDGLLAYFGWPRAHDDDAPRAVHAALAVLDATKTLAERMRIEHGIALELRIGIHTGPVIIGDLGSGRHQERLALGEAPNVAARLQALAGPGRIVLSDATARLLEERFFLEDLGPQPLNGMPEPVRVHRVVGETGIRSRFDIAASTALLPLAGRRGELECLVGLWESARHGHGRIALVSGEPGVGKSRLVQALKQHVSGHGHRWGSLRCSPYFTSTPLYPATELWLQAMELAGATTPPARLAWLEEELRGHGFDLQTAVPRFAKLLRIPLPEGRYSAAPGTPEELREQAIEGVIQIIFSLAGRQPFLLVVEDLHWVDPTTAEMLRRLAERAAGRALLAVYTSRPRIEHDCGRPHIVRLELNRLPDDAVNEMIAMLGVRCALTGETARAIRERADGVPAFVEELCRYVLDASGEPGVQLRGIPATLRDSLMARLDRTGEAKQLAQLAATIGRWFSERLIEAVAKIPRERLHRDLARLVAAQVLVQDGEPPNVVYSFRHALMQELAYDSLLKRTRARYHAEIAATMEAGFSELAEQRPELLAHHFAAAGDSRKAVEYFERAGRPAGAKSAVAETLVDTRAATRPRDQGSGNETS